MTRKVEVTTPSDVEVKVARAFDAPPQLVWDFHTRPELVSRWLLGLPGWTMPVCEIDLRVGGRFRYRWRNGETGEEFGTVGTFVAIEPPSRLAHEEAMEGFEGRLDAVTTFAAQGGGTWMEVLMRFESREARDAALATGMTDGMAGSFDMLEAQLGPRVGAGE
jgi:uncharacterized protein YndB with AHSA1/START domain